MADRLNEARALRVTELMRDYQDIHRKIQIHRTNPKPEDYNEIGFSTLRQCHNEAISLLSAPFAAEMLHPLTNGDDAAKWQLQRIILDASARRLKVQKIFLRAAAAVKWVHVRDAILKGGKPKNGDNPKLYQVDNTLRQVSQRRKDDRHNSSIRAFPLTEQIQEIDDITDQRIFNAFRARDQQAGYWLDDDPALPAILNWIRMNG